MSDGLTIEFTDNAREILASYRELPARMQERLRVAMDEQNELTVGHIVKDKLTNAGPEYLNVRSGRLRGSVRRSNAVVTSEAIESEIGSNVVYAGAHEFGFDGTVQVKAHQRRGHDTFRHGGKTLSRARAAQAGLLTKAGTGRKRMGVETRATTAGYVKAHSRRMKLRARHMFGSGIADRVPDYEAALSAAIVSAAEGGAT